MHVVVMLASFLEAEIISMINPETTSLKVYLLAHGQFEREISRTANDTVLKL